MNAGETYFKELIKVFDKVQTTQMSAIEEAAAACAKALENHGMIYTFGTGHSHLLAEEIFYRAGGLAAVYPILDEPLMLTHAARSSHMERLSGYAKLLLDEVEPAAGSIILIFSNSGRNSVAIEMAQEAKKRGLVVICITNMEHSLHTTSRHASAKSSMSFVISSLTIVAVSVMRVSKFLTENQEQLPPPLVLPSCRQSLAEPLNLAVAVPKCSAVQTPMMVKRLTWHMSISTKTSLNLYKAKELI